MRWLGAGVPWIDVFKCVICKLNSKEDGVGSPLTSTVKGEAGKVRLFGVCFLPWVPLGWDAVVCFVATVLHSWN